VTLELCAIPLSLTSLLHFIFFLNTSPPTMLYPLSLHDALPISATLTIGMDQTNSYNSSLETTSASVDASRLDMKILASELCARRSEEHTSELQSLTNLVCRLLLEKKKNIQLPPPHTINTLPTTH